MRTFVVVRQVYERYGPGPTELELHQAEDLDALALKLEPDLAAVDAADCPDGEEPADPWEALSNQNGDGCDYFLVKELLTDPVTGEHTLSVALME